ncbi:MAG TPA: hypothetical protein VF585_01375 [Chthoniobacterales bacterium]|jgi:hypothetical protein
MSTTPDRDFDEVDPQAIDMAAQEEVTETSAEPEVDEQTEKLIAWDESPVSSGGMVPRVPLEDNVPPTEQLTDEGLDIADSEQRIAAEDPDFGA